MTISPVDIRAALALPPMDAPARRIPKDVLAQHGAANAADRKLIESAIERLDWWATLSPASVGIATGADPERPIPAIQLLAMTARAEPTQRLLTVIHRAIPVPIIVAIALPKNAGTRLSLAPLRRAERVAERMVVERLIVTPDLCRADEVATAFLASLKLASLPQTTLTALYGALIERVEAIMAARITDAPFALCLDAATSLARRDALARHAETEAEWLAARAAARREKRLAEQIALGSAARVIGDRLNSIVRDLAKTPAADQNVYK